MMLSEAATIATAGLAAVTLLAAVAWWRAPSTGPRTRHGAPLLALAVACALARWGREELATLCLRQDDDLRACVTEAHRAFPHRAERTRGALTRLVEQSCAAEPFERLDWLADHLQRLDRSGQDDQRALARDLLRQTCRSHAPCCTALLRHANDPERSWSPLFQAELDRWNNTLPWQTW